jgi:HEAT repeat protein/cyclophilin family peptidyl-prolyl cis-trans isomerase
LSAKSRLLAAAFAAALLVSPACLSTPPPKLPDALVVPERQKMAWILQLEDQRLLKIELPAPPPPPPTPKGKKPLPAVVVPPPTSSPDLAVLVRDAEPRIRRRAALAIGRLKDRAGTPLLAATLSDADPEVRSMAAFALGLVGDPSAEAALTPLLSDPVSHVRGRAAEALGLIAAKEAAAAIGRMVSEYGKSPAVSAMQPDDESVTVAPEAEAFKLGLFALVRLGAYDQIAEAVVTGDQVVSRWWPVAFALQRVEDKRAAPVLRRLLDGDGKYTRAFAARGLGRLKDEGAAKPLLALLEPSAKPSLEFAASAIRALGQIGAAEAATPLARLASEPATHPNLRLEAAMALGELRSPDGLAVLQDLLTDEWPTMRATALRAAAAVDPDSFVAILAGMDQDPHWRVRAALAEALGALPAEAVTERLRSMLQDEDKRVIPPVLAAFERLKVPDAHTLLLQKIDDGDPAVRAAAARGIGRLKVEGGAEALRRAYTRGIADTTYSARTAALEALVAYGRAEASSTVREALADKDWAVRIRADELLRTLEPDSAPAAIAPAPGSPLAPYDDPQLIAPSTSPHVFIETVHGTIEFELAVLDSPQTARNFVELAKKGFFNGLEVHRVVANFVVQDGDPRGDGGGGPGYTIRDELNPRPYVRGTVGMALEWRDTGGSQFFITHSPQPHLDARYTAFGHVVNGMEVVDRIKPGDTIVRVRVWDGNGWLGAPAPEDPIERGRERN